MMIENFNVIKRDGRIVPYDETRISNAIIKAVKSSHTDKEFEKFDNSQLYELMTIIKNNIILHSKTDKINVEDIQDIVERCLIKSEYADTAKEYILYRNKRSEIRNSKDSISKVIDNLLHTDSSDSNLKRDNANIDGDSAMGTMLQIGANVSKAYYPEHMMNRTAARYYKDGVIHIHDLDFYALTVTCCQIDPLKLFKGGFSTGHGYLREPNSIGTYAALAAIAIQADQNDCHGGQSIPNFDYAMVPGVYKTLKKNLIHNMNLVKMFSPTNKILSSFGDKIKDYTSKDLENLLKKYKWFIDEKNVNYHPLDDDQLIIKQSVEDTIKETRQAMEGFVHNLNSMHSRAGAQTPFSSINLGTDTSEAGRMVTENLLYALDAGLGHGETAIFPIVIFKVKEGINYNPEDPNYDLFKLSCKVTAKRLFPNFSFIDAPFNLKYYKPGHPETEVATMG